MNSRTLELTLISAKNLKNVKNLSKMDVYVVVTISGDPNSVKQKSPVHKGGGTSPEWNYTMKFTVSESAVQMNHSVLQFTLVCDRTVLSDQDIGTVYVPIKELLDIAGGSDSAVQVKYSVMTESGKEKGELTFSYRFDNAITGKMPADAYFTSSSKNAPSAPPAGYPPTDMKPTYLPAEYPPTGSPHSTSKQAGYPPTGYPATDIKPAYPTTEYPPSGSPHSASRHAGYPPAGYPPTGIPHSATTQPTRFPPMGYQPALASYPHPAATEQGYPASYPSSGYPYSATPEQGRYTPAGYSAPGCPTPPKPAGYNYTSGYPQQQAGYPPGAYGYPPMVVPPQQQQKPKKNKGLLGMGAAVVGGLLGGAILGDLGGGTTSDADFPAIAAICDDQSNFFSSVCDTFNAM